MAPALEGRTKLFGGLAGAVAGSSFLGIHLALVFQPAANSVVFGRALFAVAAGAIALTIVMITVQMRGAQSRLSLISGWIVVIGLALAALNSLPPIFDATPTSDYPSGDSRLGTFHSAHCNYRSLGVPVYSGLFLFGLTILGTSRWSKLVGAGHLIATTPAMLLVALALVADFRSLDPEFWLLAVFVSLGGGLLISAAGVFPANNRTNIPSRRLHLRRVAIIVGPLLGGAAGLLAAYDYLVVC